MRGDEARRRIGSERDGGEAAGRNANGDHARGIDVLPVRNEIERQFEISGAGGSGSDVVGIVAASETLGPAAVGVAIAAPHDDGGGPAAAGKFERLWQHRQRRHGDTIGAVARRAVREQRQRIAAWIARAHQQRFEAAEIRAEQNAERLQHERTVGARGSAGAEQRDKGPRRCVATPCCLPEIFG